MKFMTIMLCLTIAFSLTNPGKEKKRLKRAQSLPLLKSEKSGKKVTFADKPTILNEREEETKKKKRVTFDPSIDAPKKKVTFAPGTKNHNGIKKKVSFAPPASIMKDRNVKKETIPNKQVRFNDVKEEEEEIVDSNEGRDEDLFTTSLGNKN